MEYYNIESDYIDSLEFLSPAVKRTHNIREVSVGSVYNSTGNNNQVLRRHKHTKSHEKITLSKRNRKEYAESSTSLILQKTSERQILDRCSIVSYTSLHAPKLNTTQLKKSSKCVESKAKPLIRVTVIPKSDQAQTAKLLRKRRHTTNRIHSTLSNLENSIQTKNVYLVVAGRRQDKIYEIKTTGSATFSSDHTDRNDKLSVDALSNVRQLIKSLNMDRTTIDEKQLNSTEQFFANCGNDPYKSEEFVTFPHSSKTEKRSNNRSRVRIYGQLGLTNDDCYVLRYGATANDQPVSDFGQLVNDPSKDVTPVTRAVATRDDSRLFKKDASIQASYEEICEQTRSAATYFPFGATQATQVNFNVQVSTIKNQGYEYVRTNEQNTQCSCNSIPENCDSRKRLKDCPSPLVIISVYPKPSPEDITNKSGKINSTSTIKRKVSPTRTTRHKTTETTGVRVVKVDKSIDRKTYGKKVNKRDTLAFRNGDISPVKNGCKSPVRNRDRSPERDRDTPPAKNRNTSPARYGDTSRARNRDMSPVRYGDTSPVRNRDTSPVRHSAKSPVKYGDTSPVRNRITSPIGHKDTLSLRNRDTSPVRYTDTSPIRNGNTKKKNRQVTNSGSPSHIQKKSEANTSDDLVISKVVKSQNVKKTIENNKTLNIIKKNILDEERHEDEIRNFRKCTHMQQHNKKSTHNQGHFNEMGMNTEQAKAKKVLVDNYTKTLNKHWNQKDLNRTNASNSKVRVSIDAENEYYNVLMAQSKFEYNLRNKNTMKPSCSNNRRNLSESLQNLFEIPDKETTVNPISIAVHKQNEDIPESERNSGLTIRDSLEISHRRGDKNYYMKNTQTCFAHCNDYVINDTQYLAPIKHYIGDDCSISDPIQRDKEIRELLGVDKTKVYSSDDDRPYSCFYRRQCEKTHIAQFNLVKLCPRLTNKKTAKKKDTEYNDCITETCPELCCPHALCKINAECLDSQTTRYQENYPIKDTCDKIQQHGSLCPNIQPTKQQCANQIQHQENELLQKQMLLEQQQQQLNLQKQMFLQQQERYIRQQEINTGVCCSANKIEQESSIDGNGKEDSHCFNTSQKNAESSAIYQQLILNRNIQVFLQVEQFSKQRPIVLSRKQYDKVKKTIQNTILSSRDKRKKILGKFTFSNVSVGEIRKKTNIQRRQSYDQETQADLIACSGSSNRKINKKYKEKSRYKRHKFERCCDKKPECFNYDSSTTCCSSSCSESDRKRYSEKCQKSKYNHVEPNNGCCESYEDCCMEREQCEPTGDNCSAPAYSPSGCCNYKERSYPPTYGNYPTQSKFTCNTENETITDDICGPSGLISQCNKADVNVEQGVGEYKIQRQCNSARPMGKVAYNPSDHRQLHITGPELYRQYNEVVEGFTDMKSLQPPVYYDMTLGNIESNLDQHVRANKSEKPLEVSKELIGYSTKLERHVGQREFKTYIENSHCEIPRRLNADINLLKTKGQYKNNIQLEYRRRDGEQKNTIIGCNAINNDNHRFNKTLSSMEIHFTSLAYTKERRLDMSTTDIAVLSESNLVPVESFKTIFRGHRKSPTPNLGTSIFSLFSGEGRSEKSSTFIMAPKDVKPAKKPFLRRLMSCLVMRHARVSELKLPTAPVKELPSVNSSIDSYHISTSLGAVEISSSIYDTSASFYSNHSILPINSKIKRGFFSSVRGFLTNRKS